MSYNSYNYEELKSSPVLDFTLSATIGYKISLTESGFEQVLDHAEFHGITFQDALAEIAELVDNHAWKEESPFQVLSVVHRESDLWEN